MKRLMPILKTADYRKDEKFFFKEHLFNDDFSPIIAFGEDTGEMVMYNSASDEDDFKEKFPKIKEEALRNLISINVTFEVADTEGTKTLFAEGHEYASEKILDKDFMREVAKTLKCNTVMVGIPFKGLLIAIDANSSMRLKLPVVIKKYYDNPQQDRISDKVFLVENGEIIAMGGEKLEDTNKNFSITEHTLTKNFSIKLNSKNIDELTEDVNLSFQQALLMAMERKAFGGKLSFYLNDTIPLNQELIDKCNSYIEQISKNEVLQVLTKTMTKGNVMFEFYHNKKLIAPIISKKKDTSNKKKWWKFGK